VHPSGYGRDTDADYFGWGGEDDDFCMRLMLQLHTDWEQAAKALVDSIDDGARRDAACDPNRTLADVLLHRPRRGEGRFLSLGSAHSHRDDERARLNFALVKAAERLLAKGVTSHFKLEGLSSTPLIGTARWERVEYPTHVLLRVQPPKDFKPPS
jgi:hypothetical protein